MLEIPGYQIFEKIYQGNYSTIYRGMKLNDDHHSVIIKVPHSNTQMAGKLRNEFKLLQNLISEHAVKYQALLDDFTHGCILIEEDEQAENLAHYIPNNGLEINSFLDIAIQLTKGLYDIHQHNIVHNNINLSNLIYQTDTGKVKYIDFSNAFPLPQIKQVTICSEFFVDNLSYISPEQTGRTNRLLDYRTDFYSLGIIFYQLLCGQLPFETKDLLQLIHWHIAKQPIAPHDIKPSIPKQLSDIVMKLLKKNAEDRYQSAQGILIDLKKCADDLRTKSEIVPFMLAQHDLPEHFYMPQKLYGREHELNLLIQALDQVNQQDPDNHPRVLMVTGPAGSGKSMLVNEIKSAVTVKNGNFLCSKFDQTKRNVAYNAITNVFQLWVKQILLGCNEENIRMWKIKLLLALGNNGQVLIDVIPDLEWIIGKQSPVSVLDVIQSKNRFHLTFQNFITALAQPEHPLVLFLDDWQWADAASLSLLEELIINPATKHLLLIGAYRDNEVETTHPAIQSLTAMQKAGVIVQMIPLPPLTESSINQWLAEALHSSLDETFPLTKLMYQKTQGNPFFIRIFLQALYEHQLLKLTNKGWQWDLHKIKQVPATDNVIEFLMHQIQRLSVQAQEILKLASCLGHHFTLNTLQHIAQINLEVVLAEAQALANRGFLLRIEEDFQFAHDRIQEATYGLIAFEKRNLLHLAIGRLLRTKLHFNSAPEEWFEVVNHFNKGSTFINDPIEQLQLAQLNLVAAKKAKSAIAYVIALNYLHAAASCLTKKNIWQENYLLAYDFYKELVEVEYLNGNFAASAEYADIVLANAQTVLEKAEIYNLIIAQKTLLAQYQEAITLGYQALQLFGVSFDTTDLSQSLQIETDTVKKNLQDKTTDTILSAPEIQQAAIDALLKVINNIAPPAFFSNQTLYELLVARAVNISLTYGSSKESIIDYVAYGALLCSKSNDIALGYKFGLMGIQFCERFQSYTYQCRSNFLYTDFIHHWAKPLRQGLQFAEVVKRTGLEAGEFQYLGYISQYQLLNFFYTGIPLNKVYMELNKLLQLPYNLNNQVVITIIHSLRLVILNLMSQTKESMLFHDRTKSEQEYLAEWQREKHFYALADYPLLKAQALYLHGHVEQAFEALLSAKNYLCYIPGTYSIAIYHFYYSLCITALYPTADAKTQLSYWEQLESNQIQMKVWADHCPENFLHKYFLIAAEMARIQNKDWEAADLYDQAIRAAQQQSFIQEHALSCELAARFWLSKGRPYCTETYINYAYNSYSQWGAKRKMAMLVEQYSEHLKPAAIRLLNDYSISNEMAPTASSIALIDINSILRASQTISSEIELPKLLHRMMQVIVENAGAQKSAFWIEEDNHLSLQAEFNLEGQIQTLQRLPLTHWKNGPQSLIDYVKRTQQTVLIGDADHDQQFKCDSFISTHHIKSVLCIPIIRQQHLIGILYLENNLLPHAFTYQHQQILTIIASQIAVSLENSMLYESMRLITERLNLALQSSNIGTWSWNIRDNKMDWDENMNTLYGVSKENFAYTAESFMKLVHPDDRIIVEQAIQQTLTKKTPYSLEHRIIKPSDNSIHVVIAQGKVYRDEYDQIERVIGITWDVTERKRLEEERLQALKYAEEQEHQRAEEAVKYRKEQIEFIDTVCHEIRNPMSGIYGNVDFLKQTATSLKSLRDSLPTHQQQIVDEKLRKLEESINVIDQCVRHQKIIIDDVLNLSKLESDKAALELKPFQLNSLIEDTLRIYAIQLDNKHLDLQLALPEQMITIQGDPDRFKIILMNLISNAIKFTKQGHIKISLHTQTMAATQVALTLSVEDTGMGMTPDQQAHLFQRFYRPASSQYIEGSGLGLTICKKIIELMKGTIQVESQPARGSKFTIHLVCKTAAVEANLISEKPVLSQPMILPSRLKHILVAEDNVVNQKILKRQLEQASYQCTVANNGQEALEKYKEIAFDLILMDMQMPVMDGLEATKRIREHEKQLGSAQQVPIVGLSAYARAEFAQQAQNAGMNAYITKPYEKKEIYQVINECIASSLATSPRPQCTNLDAQIAPASSSNKNYATAIFGDIESISRQMVGRYQGNDIVFDVFHTKTYGGNSFYGLPIPYDRAGVVTLLISHLSNTHIRALIADEIIESLKLNYLPPSFYLSFSQLSRFKSYQAEIDLVQAQLLQQTLYRIDPSQTLIANRQFEQVLNYLQRKVDRTEVENSCLEQMLKFQQDDQIKLNEYKTFCQNEAVVAAFLQEYIGKQGKLSFTAEEIHFECTASFLDAILECTHPPLHLIIWENDPADATRIKIAHEGGHPAETVTNIYHHGGRDTPFELMAETNQPLYSLLPTPPVELPTTTGVAVISSTSTERRKLASDQNIDDDQAKHDAKKLAQACAAQGLFSSSHHPQSLPQKQPDQNPSFSC